MSSTEKESSAARSQPKVTLKVWILTEERSIPHPKVFMAKQALVDSLLLAPTGVKLKTLMRTKKKTMLKKS